MAHYATVEDEFIIYEGRAVSPAEFAKAAGGEHRNAWRMIWLRFPGETAWRLAARCRQ